MGRIVSIVAQNPKHEKPESDNLCNQDEGDLAIGTLMTNLRKTHKPGKHDLYRASSVEALAFRLIEDKEKYGPPELIQIIGHGSPGMLSLGRYWTHHYASRGRNRSIYVLDSSPYTYGVLDGKVDSSTCVYLIGCALGEESNTVRPYVADGPSLLFDLARMWSCEVSAPVRLITPDDFDPNTGVFNDEKVLARAYHLHVSVPPKEPSGLMGSASQNLMSALPADLLRDFNIRVDFRPMLALPERRFSVRLEKLWWKASILGNGRILRLHSDANSSAESDIRDFIRRNDAP